MAGAFELAGDDAEMTAEALAMARETALSLGGRLRFMRAAWGDGSVAMDGAELLALAAGLPTGRRTRLLFDGVSPARPFSAHAVRLLLNLLLVAVESLAGEGLVSALGASDGDLLITLTGPRAAWPPGFVGQLADPGTALKAARQAEARTLQGPLAALIAHDAGVSVRMLLGASAAAPPLLIRLP